MWAWFLLAPHGPTLAAQGVSQPLETRVTEGAILFPTLEVINKPKTRCPAFFKVTREELAWEPLPNTDPACQRFSFRLPRRLVSKVKEYYGSLEIQSPQGKWRIGLGYSGFDYLRLALVGQPFTPAHQSLQRFFSAFEDFDQALAFERKFQQARRQGPPILLTGSRRELPFIVWHWYDCSGILFVSDDRLRYVPLWPANQEHAFDLPRSSLQSLLAKDVGKIFEHIELITGEGRKYNLGENWVPDGEGLMGALIRAGMTKAALDFPRAMNDPELQQAIEAETQAVFYGTVFDAGGHPIPGVTVTLENAASGYRRSVVTNDDGTYVFAKVPPGNNYKATASKDGRTLDIRAGMALNAGDERMILPPLKEQAPRNLALTFSTQPGAAQVYLNDEFRGTTGSDDGKLVIRELVPGSYRIRLSAPGYEDWRQEVSLTSDRTLEARLQRSGPPPFTLQDVVKMLEGDIHPKRVATLVQETGVDFALTDAAEKQLRAVGADSDLLLAIARGKK